MDLMTNLMFDVETFISNTPTWRFTREAPYAAIRVSYHPGQNDIDDLIRKTFRLQEAGFRIGVYGIEHPRQVGQTAYPGSAGALPQAGARFPHQGVSG